MHMLRYAAGACLLATPLLCQNAWAAGPEVQTPAAQTPSAETGSATAQEAPPAGFPAPETAAGPLTFGGEVNTHLQAEMTKASGTDAKGTLFDDTDLPLYANYSNWASLNSDIKLERQRNDNEDDYFPDRNAFLRSEGLTLRQLYATLYPTDGASVYGGKIHPAFGSAWDATPGNFYNFGADYEQDERIGFGGQVRLPDDWGMDHAKLAVETFFLDTSFLSNSVLSHPGLDDPEADRLGRYTPGQYGPSNTGRLDSYTVSLRGGRPEQGIAYQASFTSEATDAPGGHREYGESIGASYDPSGDGIPLTSRLGLTPFLEYTHFTNFSGAAGLERHYLVGGATFTYDRWQFIPAAGLRKSYGSASATDHQENFSVNYTITETLSVGAGVNYVNIAAKGSWTFGPSLNYAIKF